MSRRWRERMEPKFKCSKLKIILHNVTHVCTKNNRIKIVRSFLQFRHPSIDGMKQGFECLEGLLEQVSQAVLQNYSHQPLNQDTLLALRRGLQICLFLLRNTIQTYFLVGLV